jgi:hypothetical protein
VLAALILVPAMRAAPPPAEAPAAQVEPVRAA